MQKVLPKSLKELACKVPQKRLKQIEIHLANSCNLRCKGCDHFSCICENESFNEKQFYKDIQRLYSIFDGDIEKILLLGGEPLLNKNVDKLIDATAKLFVNSEIDVVTNGTLILRQKDSFFESCRKDNVKIVITKYPIDFDYLEVEKFLIEKGCNFEYFGNTGYKKKTSYKIPLDISGKQDVEFNFKNCFYANHCVQLFEGKIFTCTPPAYIQFFNKKFNRNLIISKNDYINIYDDITKDEILHRLAQPIEFCKYCNVKERVFDLEWSVSNGKENEWTN